MDKLFSILIKVSIIIISVISISFIFKYTIIYIYPFIIAFAIAYILHPIVTYIEIHLKIKRSIATLFIIISFFISSFTILFFLLKRLLLEATEFIQKLPLHIASFTSLLETIGNRSILLYEKLTKSIPLLPEMNELNINTYVRLINEHFEASSIAFFSNIIQFTTTILSSLTYIGMISSFILILVYFLTKDMPKINNVFHETVSNKIKVKTRQLLHQLKKSVWAFVKAQIIITLVSSIIICIGLLFMNVEHVFTIVLVVLIVDFIPYIGIGAVFIPWIGYAFFSMQYGLTIQLSILYAFVIIIRQIIEPKILATNMGIHPLIAFSVLFIGIQALGIAGILLTPLILIFLSALYHIRFFHIISNFVKN